MLEEQQNSATNAAASDEGYDEEVDAAPLPNNSVQSQQSDGSLEVSESNVRPVSNVPSITVAKISVTRIAAMAIKVTRAIIAPRTSDEVSIEGATAATEQGWRWCQW
ncbi:hypothetical protein QAD02_024453 [Eretmocerus hayati]|uniref:Uncharacterized protein n=1 Tax=Eretmocerus hayati TaxID=131215 RepID=A0ACC2PYR8_9HYME|nr:hypothetical protein QAD02_024453 [Eretmocerus hayati]